jgi:hypothetical protein
MVTHLSLSPLAEEPLLPRWAEPDSGIEAVITPATAGIPGIAAAVRHLRHLIDAFGHLFSGSCPECGARRWLVLEETSGLRVECRCCGWSRHAGAQEV